MDRRKKVINPKDYLFDRGGLKGSKKKPRVAKEQKGRSFEDAYGRFKDDIRKNMTPRKMSTPYISNFYSDNKKEQALVDKYGSHYGHSFWLLQTPINSVTEKTVSRLVELGELSPSEIDDKVRNMTPRKMARGGKTNSKEYVLWGIPKGKIDEEILLTKNPKGQKLTLREAKMFTDVLEKKYGVKKVRIQEVDLRGSFDFSKEVLNKSSMAKGGKISHLGRAYLGELWFAVHEKNTSKYKSLANKLDREGVPMYIQNRVSSDASETTKKAIDTAEVKDRIDKIVAQKMARGGEVKVGDKVKSKSYDYYSLNKGVVKTLVNGKSLIEGIEEDEGREVYGNIKNFQKYARGGKIEEKIKILKKEGYPHRQAVAIALSMRDSGKLARGGKIKDFEKGKWLQGKQWHIYKNNGWQLERYRGDILIEQYSISVEKGDVDFIKYTPNYEGRIKIPENVQLKVIKLLSKVNPKFNFGDEYENQIRVNQYSDMYARGGEVENEMIDADWDKIFGGLDKEPTQEEIELEKIAQKEGQKQIRNNFAKHLGYGVSWDKVVLDLVKDTKFMISNTNNASLGENNNTRSYIFENIKHLKRLRYGAEKYANMLLDLYQKKLDSLRKRN